MAHEPPERLKHVFEFYDLEPAFTPERGNWLKDGRGFVYVIQCNEFTKIGVAENVDTRLAYLQVGNPYELRLLKTFPSLNPVVDEEKLQSRFGRYHIRGEWFRLPPTLLHGLVRLKDLMNVRADSARVRNQARPARRRTMKQETPTR